MWYFYLIWRISRFSKLQCENYRNLLSRKISWKGMVLLKKLVNGWFDEFFRYEQIFHFSTLCYFSTMFVTWLHCLVKQLLWRNFCQKSVIRNVHNFHFVEDQETKQTGGEIKHGQWSHTSNLSRQRNWARSIESIELKNEDTRFMHMDSIFD